MARFLSALTALALVGCAGPAPSSVPLVRLSDPPPNALAVAPHELDLPAEAWKVNLAPFVPLENELQGFPANRLLPGEEGSSKAADEGPLQPVLEILRDFVAPGRWDRSTLTIDKGALVTEQPPALLAALQSALKTLLTNQGRMVHSQVRMVALRADALARFENIPPVGGGLVGTFDRKALSGAFRGPLSGLSGFDGFPTGVDGVLSPSITTFHGQKSHVMFLAQKAYVAGYEVGEGTPAMQLGITTEGIVAELRTIANGGRPDEFLISFNVQVASPSQVVDVRLGSGTVQMPAQGFAHVSGRCALRADQALLLVTRNPDLRQTDCPIVALVITVDWASER